MTTPGTMEVAVMPAPLTDPVKLQSTPTLTPVQRVQTPARAKQPVNPPVAPAPQRRPIFVEAGITEPTREQIRERAYQIYLGRNGNPGCAESDWLLAEAQLRAEARKRMGYS